MSEMQLLAKYYKIVVLLLIYTKNIIVSFECIFRWSSVTLVSCEVGFGFNSWTIKSEVAITTWNSVLASRNVSGSGCILWKQKHVDEKNWKQTRKRMTFEKRKHSIFNCFHIPAGSISLLYLSGNSVARFLRMIFLRVKSQTKPFIWSFI